MAWSEELENDLRKLWNKMSAGEIAKRLGHGLTRNAVIGKGNRLGLVRDVGIRRNKSSVNNREKLITAANVSQAIHRIRKRIINEPDQQPVKIINQNSTDDFNIPSTQRKALLQLTRHTCHWPVGDPRSGDFFYCGGDNVPGSPYCASHKRRLHVQAQEGSTPSTGWVAHKPMPVMRKAGMR